LLHGAAALPSRRKINSARRQVRSSERGRVKANSNGDASYRAAASRLRSTCRRLGTSPLHRTAARAASFARLALYSLVLRVGFLCRVLSRCGRYAFFGTVLLDLSSLRYLVRIFALPFLVL